MNFFLDIINEKGLHARASAKFVEAVGFKFGRWVDSVTLQLPLGEGSATLPPA